MAIKECGRGHMYDANLHASCPYCISGQALIDFSRPGVPVGSAGETRAPVGYQPNPIPMGTAAVDAGRTMPPVNWNVPEEKTAVAGEPVVGWLVCLDGQAKGRDYRLYSKINTIGRGETADIPLDDPTVVSGVHAGLAYDPKHNNFNFIPGNNANNIYINDEPVYAPVCLQAYDVLEIGRTRLVFVPLCGGRFSWETGLTKEDIANGEG